MLPANLLATTGQVCYTPLSWFPTQLRSSLIKSSLIESASRDMNTFRKDLEYYTGERNILFSSNVLLTLSILSKYKSLSNIT